MTDTPPPDPGDPGPDAPDAPDAAAPEPAHDPYADVPLKTPGPEAVAAAAAAGPRDPLLAGPGRPRREDRIVSEELVFEEPPPAKSGGGGRRGVWVEKLSPLMARPGESARLMVFNDDRMADKTAANLRAGKMQIPESSVGKFEFTSRKDWPEKGQSSLYAKFVLDEAQEPPEPRRQDGLEPMPPPPGLEDVEVHDGVARGEDAPAVRIDEARNPDEPDLVPVAPMLGITKVPDF